MSKIILNAAPMVIDYGTQDLSFRRVPRFNATPQHVAKFFLYAEKGPDKPVYVSPNNLVYLFGEKTWQEHSKFFNHATLFAKRVAAEGNSLMVHRLLPPDVGPRANVILYLDVLKTTVDIYERNTDGSIKLDANSQPIITGTTTGHKVKWVTGHYATRGEQEAFGAQTIMPGNQVDPNTGATSQRYPIAEFEAYGYGSWYNRIGVKLRAPVNARPDSGYFNSNMYETTGVYPHIANVVEKLENGRVMSKADKMGALDLFFSFKEGTMDETGRLEYNLRARLIDAFTTMDDPQYEDIFPDIGRVHVYYEHLNGLIEEFFTAEIPLIDEHTEFTANPEDKFKMNIVTGLRPNGSPYHSFVFVDAPDSIRLGDNTVVYLRGATDGTMTDAVFAQQVSDYMYDYLDEQSEAMDIAYNIESVIYDSGFPLETKYQLCNIIAKRKDTLVVLSTNVAGEEYTDRGHELAVGAALKSYLMMFPESDYFNTPVMRGMIVAGSGKVRNSSYVKRVPLTYEVAAKSAHYMGAGNGAWVPGRNFDGAPGSILDEMYSISNPWVPAFQRNVLWQVGVNWVQRYDRRNYFFPAFKTVYFDDTSVLNSYFTASAICYLNKLAHAAWREFTGVSHLTNAQLIDRVNSFIRDQVKGKFDNRFVIVPDAHITDMDLLRGYSWALPIKIYAPNMKTVMTTYVQAYRMDDLEAAP